MCRAVSLSRGLQPHLTILHNVIVMDAGGNNDEVGLVVQSTAVTNGPCVDKMQRVSQLLAYKSFVLYPNIISCKAGMTLEEHKVPAIRYLKWSLGQLA